MYSFLNKENNAIQSRVRSCFNVISDLNSNASSLALCVRRREEDIMEYRDGSSNL